VRVVHDPTADDLSPLTLATDVSVANSFVSRARGLMLRSVPEDSAMVFPFDRPGKQWIHTALVLVHIDVVWTVEDEVTRVEQMRPLFDLAGARADRVVEFPAGASDGISVGETVRVESE
jgi:uncharacterized membrane protein (UPF0127 family)